MVHVGVFSWFHGNAASIIMFEVFCKKIETILVVGFLKQSLRIIEGDRKFNGLMLLLNMY